MMREADQPATQTNGIATANSTTRFGSKRVSPLRVMYAPMGTDMPPPPPPEPRLFSSSEAASPPPKPKLLKATGTIVLPSILMGSPYATLTPPFETVSARSVVPHVKLSAKDKLCLIYRERVALGVGIVVPHG